MLRMYMTEHMNVMVVRTEKMPAITGISRKVYELLQARPLLSVEILSAHNVHALLSTHKGDHIFLTPILREDLFPKAEGLVCEILEKNASLQKTRNQDEVEIVAVRIQVRPIGAARIKNVEVKALDQGVDVEVERMVRCRIS